MKDGSGARRQGTRKLEVTVASQRRKQILDAARACISEDGVERLTLRKVAERARISHAAIAYYFHTRHQLMDAALLQISEEFMDVLRQRELIYGPQDLADLLETFLDGSSPTARFVVQMIDAGRRDMQLRGTHDEFLAYGRDRIEKSIRVGVDSGFYRPDIDPKLAAALVHTLLIWWESELAADATSREFALDVGRLALRLLEDPGLQRPADGLNGNHRKAAGGRARLGLRTEVRSPPEVIEASLLSDPALSPEAAHTLAASFKQLYWLAAGVAAQAGTNGGAGSSDGQARAGPAATATASGARDV